MSGLSEATLPAQDPVAPSPAERERAEPAWPTLVTLAAWTLIGLGISAHDGEWSSWGLGALLVAFVMLLAVAAAGREIGVPNRRMLTLPVALCLVAAVVHPAYRLMHVRGAGVVAVEVLAAVTLAVAPATLALRGQGEAWWLGAGLAAVTGI